MIFEKKPAPDGGGVLTDVHARDRVNKRPKIQSRVRKRGGSGETARGEDSEFQQGEILWGEREPNDESLEQNLPCLMMSAASRLVVVVVGSRSITIGHGRRC